MFQQDLNFGKKWEKQAISMIPDDETLAEVAPNGAFKPWDFKTNLNKYEVKADRLAYKYGCKTMYIEYECNGSPSGISSTEADFWFYFMVKPNGEYVCYEIPVPLLREKCKNPLRSVSGGDGMRSRGHIVDVREFQQFRLENNSTATGTAACGDAICRNATHGTAPFVS
jgi:hypothetical protein